MKSVSIPAEETATCPHCGKPAGVIDGTRTKVTTACMNCGRTINAQRGAPSQ